MAYYKVTVRGLTTPELEAFYKTLRSAGYEPAGDRVQVEVDKDGLDFAAAGPGTYARKEVA